MEKKGSVEELSAQLAGDIARWTEGEQVVETAVEGLNFYRQVAPTDCSACMVEPSIALVAQGAKCMVLGEESFRYDQHHFLITSLDLPAVMQVLDASSENPYLGLALKLDLRTVGELMLQAPVSASATRDQAQGRGMGRGMVLGQTTPVLLGAFRRLVAMLDEPESIPVLAPLVMREICWRVLMSEQGMRLRQIVSVGSQSHRVVRAIEWLKAHYDEPLHVKELAELSQMSLSTFHHHFRELTAMSPLQYQKWLRLTEARRLMLGEAFDAAKAAYEVGYESPSQFSREYTRMFGASPKRDIAALLEQSGDSAA